MLGELQLHVVYVRRHHIEPEGRGAEQQALCAHGERPAHTYSEKGRGQQGRGGGAERQRSERKGGGGIPEECCEEPGAAERCEKSVDGDLPHAELQAEWMAEVDAVVASAVDRRPVRPRKPAARSP